MNPKISILLPAYKSKDLMREVFLKGFKNNISVDCELIIYDNDEEGNKFGDLFSCSMISQDIKIIGNGENKGLNYALNRCAEIATGDYFFLPHTDMYILPGCLESLLNEAKKHAPHTFLFCSRSIEPGYSHIQSQIRKDYGNEWNNFQKEKLIKEYQKYKENKIVINARMPFFMHRKLWEKMNGVDENYFSYCTDDDLIQEAYHVGVRKFYMIYNSLVYHLQGKSNSQQSVDRDDKKPYEYFVNKWRKRGYEDCEHPGQWHPRLIPFELRVK